MIFTLKANNGSFANFGSVAIQPKPASSLISQVLKQASVLVKQAALPRPVMLLKSTHIQPIQYPTLSTMVSHITTNNNFIFPMHNYFSVIMPTNALTLDAGKTYDPRVTQGFIGTTTKFQPYEQLTGISHERPEIVMLTNFQPLFDRDVSHTAPHFIGAFEESGQYQFMTDAGRYLDAQFHMRSLQVFNMQRQLQMVRSRYYPMHQLMLQKTDDFSRGINQLKEDASFLLNLVRIIESQKRQLDMRHDIYKVDPVSVANTIVTNYSQHRLTMAPNSAPSMLKMLTSIGNRSRYDCVDCLVDVGYSEDVVKNVFSSTKIWLQLCAELKGVLKHHSLKFLDIDPTYQRKDDNATSILQPPIKRFELSETLPAIPDLDELIKLQIGNVSKTIGLISPAFTSIYQNIFFKNEEARIAALANLLSKEFRYSEGLSYPQVQARLKTFYGYDVSPAGNLAVFDAVCGRFGNNITDFPANNDVTLASIAQQRTATSGILTFETKYVEGDTGTLSPGGDFYFDRIMQTNGDKFDTAAIEQLSAALQNHADNFSILNDVMNLMGAPEGHFLENAGKMIHELGDKLVNPQNGVVQRAVQDDRIGAVYSQASKDTRIKTILFLLTMCRMSRTYSVNIPFFSSEYSADNTPVVDHLINELVNTLESTIPESRTATELVIRRRLDKEWGRQLNTSSLTKDSIKHSLKSGTVSTRIVESFMSNVLSQFRSRTSAITNKYSRFGGYLDTIVMMMAFDFAIAMVARYSSQQLVGVHRGLSSFYAGQTTFAISQTTTNHYASYNELLQRVKGEDNITRQLVMTVINSLRNLSGSLKGITNYLNSPDAINKLRQIARVLKNDPNTIRMLMSEQQILLLASTVENLVAANNQGNFQLGDGKGSYNDTGDIADKQVAVLDESEVPPAMHEAILGFFGTGDFASQHGINKRIITVGIPLGFSERLKQKVSIRDQKKTSFQSKQNDIIQVTVYKCDLQNADIIYKPVRFLFELSRFPTRFGTAKWLPLPQHPSIKDIINAIPTQNYTTNPGAGTANSITAGVEYASTNVGGSSDMLRGKRVAFDDSTYNFLTNGQKTEVLHNHVVSQLLEVYVKLMTGINVAEYTYNLVDPPAQVDEDTVRELTNHALQHVSDTVSTLNATPLLRSAPVGGVLFTSTGFKKFNRAGNTWGGDDNSAPDFFGSSTGIAGHVSAAAMYRSVQPAAPSKSVLEQARVFDVADRYLDNISHRHVPLVMNHLKTISGFSHTLSSMSSVDALNHRVLSPKQFDRVFNVVVDARDFEIDVPKTMRTPHGRQAIELLIRHGDVVPADSRFAANRHASMSLAQALGRTESRGRQPINVNNYRFRDRDKTQGDLIADKYFVTIETFGEDDV